MIEKDIKEIIPQIPGESDSSYARLLIMLTQGLLTLPELQKHLDKEDHKYKVSLGQLRACSAKDKWTERRKRYYELREQELKEEVEEIFQELNVIGIHDMKQFMSELGELKEDIITSYRNNNYKASYLFKILKDYIYCYREATEIYYINSRHKLEPDVETEDIVTLEEEVVNSDLLGEEQMQARQEYIQQLLKGDKQ